MSISTVKKKQNSIYSSSEVSLESFCSQLSISVATGKNWIKLGKIKPKSKGNIIYFNQGYIDKLKNEISKEDNKVLKSRRNKKYVSGNMLYKSYVEANSANLISVNSILDLIHQNSITITNDLIRCLIYDCAIQLILSKYKKNQCISRAFESFLKDEISIDKFDNLFKFNGDDKKVYLGIINKHKELFEINYCFEENNDVLGLIYISLKNIGDRKITGTYYTPERIVKKLNLKLFEGEKINNIKILDPCCGTGNFLLNLPPEIKFSQIYASDIDEESIKIAQLNMAIKYNITDKKILDSHIKVCDFVREYFDNDFDIVLGNPPWGYAYSKEEKKELVNNYYSAFGNNVESFDLFIEKAGKVLKKGGYISFVLPESLLNVKSHTRIREIIINGFNIKSLEYIGNAFDKVQCPSIIIKLQKTDEHVNLKGTEICINGKQFIIKKDRKISPEYFSLTTDDFEYEIIDKINSIKNKVYLKDNAIFALGIVTGSNTNSIYNKKSNDNELVLRGKDIYKYTYIDGGEYIKFEPEKFQQVAPTKYYRASEKLFYRFISSKLVFAYDNKKTLSLNSCNILIPALEDIDIKYVMAVLNSKVVQYYFDKSFNSIKILRSHIESIPIPKISINEQKKIIEKVDKLIKSKDKVIETYDEIDELIAKEYNISKEEYKYIRDIYNNQEMFLTKM